MHLPSLDRNISRRRKAAQNWLQPHVLVSAEEIGIASSPALPAQPSLRQHYLKSDGMPAHLVSMLIKIISIILKIRMILAFLII